MQSHSSAPQCRRWFSWFPRNLSKRGESMSTPTWDQVQSSRSLINEISPPPIDYINGHPRLIRLTYKRRLHQWLSVLLPILSKYHSCRTHLQDSETSWQLFLPRESIQVNMASPAFAVSSWTHNAFVNHLLCRSAIASLPWSRIYCSLSMSAAVEGFFFGVLFCFVHLLVQSGGWWCGRLRPLFQ